VPLTAFDIGHPAAEHVGKTLLARPGLLAEGGDGDTFPAVLSGG
jgi:hypothetical protein